MATEKNMSNLAHDTLLVNYFFLLILVNEQLKKLMKRKSTRRHIILKPNNEPKQDCAT